MRSEFLSPKERYKLLYKKQEIFEEELREKRELKQIEVFFLEKVVKKPLKGSKRMHFRSK